MCLIFPPTVPPSRLIRPCVQDRGGMLMTSVDLLRLSVAEICQTLKAVETNSSPHFSVSVCCSLADLWVTHYVSSSGRFLLPTLGMAGFRLPVLILQVPEETRNSDFQSCYCTAMFVAAQNCLADVFFLCRIFTVSEGSVSPTSSTLNQVPSPSPGACSNSCPLSQWCHPTVSSSATPFSSCPHTSCFSLCEL